MLCYILTHLSLVVCPCPSSHNPMVQNNLFLLEEIVSLFCFSYFLLSLFDTQDENKARLRPTQLWYSQTPGDTDHRTPSLVLQGLENSTVRIRIFYSWVFSTKYLSVHHNAVVHYNMYSYHTIFLIFVVSDINKVCGLL